MAVFRDSGSSLRLAFTAFHASISIWAYAMAIFAMDWTYCGLHQLSFLLVEFLNNCHRRKAGTLQTMDFDQLTESFGSFRVPLVDSKRERGINLSILGLSQSFGILFTQPVFSTRLVMRLRQYLYTPSLRTNSSNLATGSGMLYTSGNSRCSASCLSHFSAGRKVFLHLHKSLVEYTKHTRNALDIA